MAFGFANKSRPRPAISPPEIASSCPRSANTASAAFICYESVFPNFVRQFANSGAEVLVNISNDGWFGHSAAREQHLKIVRMRAAENRRWILRSTNDGITAIIDPSGRVTERFRLQETGARMRFGYEATNHVLLAPRRLVCVVLPGGRTRIIGGRSGPGGQTKPSTRLSVVAMR